jgi:hypothetical protein
MDVRTTIAGNERRCPQCTKWKLWPALFIGRRGRPVNRCQVCQARYAGWGSLSLEERTARRAAHEVPIPGAGGVRVRWTPVTHNVKTGPIPVSVTDRDSCPTSCSYRGAGCYAEESNHTRLHWGRTAERGLEWPAFLRKVRALPRGQLWRHNEAGDLPGPGDVIDASLLAGLARANEAAGARGFTFTHKPLTHANEAAIRHAIAHRFAINLSADTIAEADALVARGVAPVAVVVPADHPARATRTPAGSTLVVCTAQTNEGMTCERCRLCAVLGRKSIIAFRAHGLRHELASSIARGEEEPHEVRGVRDPLDPRRGALAALPLAPASGGKARRVLPVLPQGADAARPHGGHVAAQGRVGARGAVRALPSGTPR